MRPGDVVYLKRDDAPGRYFRCSRYGMLSVNSCSANFSAAPRLSSEGRLSGCIGCPVGILHSGGHEAHPTSQLAVDAVCTRCRRDPSNATAYRSTRQGRIRMVRGGMLCVSCFNREREVLLGRNARHTKPRALVLRHQTVAYIVDARLNVARITAAKDAIEVALVLIKQSGGKALVAWVSAGIEKHNEEAVDDLEPDRPRLQVLLRESA